MGVGVRSWFRITSLPLFRMRIFIDLIVNCRIKSILLSFSPHILDLLIYALHLNLSYESRICSSQSSLYLLINFRLCLVGAFRVVYITCVPTALRTFIVLSFRHFSDRFTSIRVARYSGVSLFLTRLRSFWSLKCYRKARESASRRVRIDNYNGLSPG